MKEISYEEFALRMVKMQVDATLEFFSEEGLLYAVARIKPFESKMWVFSHISGGDAYAMDTGIWESETDTALYAREWFCSQITDIGRIFIDF